MISEMSPRKDVYPPSFYSSPSRGEDERRGWFVYYVFFFSFLFFRFSFAADWKPQGPFSHRLQNPLYLQMIQLPAERAVVTPAGELQTEMGISYSNIYERGLNATSDIVLDMELLRISPTIRYGVASDFEIGMEIPWIHMGGGFLDPFIQDFHNIFGFRNGGREKVSNNSFSSHVIHNGTTLYQFNSETFGLGDITFFGKYHFIKEGEGQPGVALRLGIKAPTGDAGEGTGGGNPGFALGADLEKSKGRLHGYFHLDYAIDAGNDSLGPINRTESLNGALAGEVSILKNISLLAELVGSTPKFHGTQTHVLDEMPLDFVTGLRGEFGLWTWQASFAEDITSRGPSVDFTTFLNVGRRISVKY